MEIIDSLVHRPFQIQEWIAGNDDEGRDLDAVHALEAEMRATGVDGALLVWSPAFNQLAYETFPDKFRGISVFEAPGATWRDTIATMVKPPLPANLMIAFEDEDDVRAKVVDLQERTGLASLRIEPGFQPMFDFEHNIGILRAGGFDPVFAVAQDLEIPVCVWLAGALGSLPAVAERFPDVWIVVDHLGLVPRPLSETGLEALPELLSMARFPKVAVNLSGAVELSHDPFPFPDVSAAVRRVVDEFGPERVLWGSDFTTFPDQVYAEALGFLFDTDTLDEPEKELVFAGNARRIFNWPRPDPG